MSKGNMWQHRNLKHHRESQQLKKGAYWDEITHIGSSTQRKKTLCFTEGRGEKKKKSLFLRAGNFKVFIEVFLH